MVFCFISDRVQRQHVAKSKVNRVFLMAALLAVGFMAKSIHAAAALQEGPQDIAGLEVIRGSVLKVSGDTYLVKTPQGMVYKVATSVNTHFVRGEQESSADAIHAGDTVVAGGDLDEKQHVLGAIFLAALDAKQLEEFDRRRTEFGKTWLAGTIVSIRGTQLVVKRPDDVTTTVTVDENTSFRKRHESITLGDIQVGDGLTARGTMGKGIFAGTLLTVVDAREISEWGRLRDR
jgi:hypothetical protein